MFSGIRVCFTIFTFLQGLTLAITRTLDSLVSLASY